MYWIHKSTEPRVENETGSSQELAVENFFGHAKPHKGQKAKIEENTEIRI